MQSGGIGEKFASMILENGYCGSWLLTAVDGEFVSHASVSSLMDKYSLSGEKMANKIYNEVMQ